MHSLQLQRSLVAAGYGDVNSVASCEFASSTEPKIPRNRSFVWELVYVNGQSATLDRVLVLIIRVRRLGSKRGPSQGKTSKATL